MDTQMKKGILEMCILFQFMVRIYHNALDISRKLKPSIPILGYFDIPLKHEIEFEFNLLNIK
ncbi:hypothetical protein SAMN02746089_02112 [Caldanaerobius fijiensis DSM 17918]|uniref:Uncharacterized protein n=1 Tax=Caldanaerobius fijiensis DSM 17918 TaxID=1121256 RepID=A0A1M5CFY8_9THEO|nr:hypothetical protein [Caldanaerobius fijiensis]SHF53674.1 hypothetical protein SAMN02746089_02112 [Caldanaerobius fijiensis DSM 17918]